MSAANTLSSVVNVLFGFFQFVLGAAILALPLITLKQPAAKSKKLMMLLSIAAIGVLILSFAVGSVSTIILISSLGAMNAGNIASMLLNLVMRIFGAILALAFPFLANAMKKEMLVLGILLALPVIQCIVAIVRNLTHTLVPGLDLPVIGSALAAQLLLLVVLVLAAVWYLTGQKRTLSLVVAIAAPVVFIVALILSIFAAKTYFGALNASVNFLSYFTSSTQFFSAHHRFLLLLLTAMGIRALGTPKAPAYVAPQVPQYPQNPQNSLDPQYPQNPQF